MAHTRRASADLSIFPEGSILRLPTPVNPASQQGTLHLVALINQGRALSDPHERSIRSSSNMMANYTLSFQVARVIIRMKKYKDRRPLIGRRSLHILSSGWLLFDAVGHIDLYINRRLAGADG